MRSQRDQDLTPLDPEIEATARRCSGEARRTKKAEVAMARQDKRVLGDYAQPQASGMTSSIVNPTVEANHIELSPALVTFVELDQLGGHPTDNPNAYLRKFLTRCDTIMINGCPRRQFDYGSSLSH